jgi:hypothetical protein
MVDDVGVANAHGCVLSVEIQTRPHFTPTSRCFTPPSCISSQIGGSVFVWIVNFTPSQLTQAMKELKMTTQFTQKIARRLVNAAAVLTIASGALAAMPAQFDSAFAQFQQARTGNENAIAQSATTFEALLKAEPINPVLMAYAGATTSMKANTTWLPWKKMGYAEDGMALLDKALSLLTAAHNAPLQHQLPAVLEVKFVAANTFLAVPGFMNRGARGSKLLGEVLASPLLASAPLEFRGDVWMAAAELALKDKRTQDARKYFDEVVKASAPQADSARAQLKAIQS